MGIIREQDRHAYTSRVDKEQRDQADAVRKALAELKHRLPQICEAIAESARSRVRFAGSTRHAFTDLPAEFRVLGKNAEAEELVKSALLKIEPNTATVKIEGKDRPVALGGQGIQVLVSFAPELN
ncbi:hypothetical protein BKG82_27140 [Mycobacteroides chelonae]|uniref:Uncharacterized protein n=1 Tax=Mycobacteroides chelonae TaxID=1774 RepID=A0A1S1LG99_MYCCH|nr:hypothetical protein [Mycobacteroides chelonae]OHU47330.1 hypothetical protein BKG82_27140 [Mycobacteroides chelonae]